MPPKGKACCSHAHDCEESNCGAQWSLYQYIDVPKVRCLNELEPRSCRTVFKPWLERTASGGQAGLKSDEDDPELLLHIPFTGSCKISSICIIGGSDSATPSTVRLFINREDLDFDTVRDLPPTQEFDLQPNPLGELEYPTQVQRFSGVHHLTMHFPGAIHGTQSHVVFVGLKGEFTERRREAVEAVYEVRPVAKANQVGAEVGGRMDIL